MISAGLGETGERYRDWETIVTFLMGTLSMLYMRWYILSEDRQLEGLSVFWLDGFIYIIGAGILLFTLAYFKLSGIE